MHPSPYRFLPVSLKLAVPGQPLAPQPLCTSDIRLHWGKRSDTVCCCHLCRLLPGIAPGSLTHRLQADPPAALMLPQIGNRCCLLYTSDAADEEDSVDLGGRRIIKKKKKRN